MSLIFPKAVPPTVDKAIPVTSLPFERIVETALSKLSSNFASAYGTTLSETIQSKEFVALKLASDNVLGSNPWIAAISNASASFFANPSTNDCK